MYSGYLGWLGKVISISFFVLLFVGAVDVSTRLVCRALGKVGIGSFVSVTYFVMLCSISVFLPSRSYKFVKSELSSTVRTLE